MILEIKKIEKKFEPFCLNFTIESKRDIEFFLSIMNASGNRLAAFVNDHLPKVQVNEPITAFEPTECVRALKSDNIWQDLKEKYNELP